MIHAAGAIRTNTSSRTQSLPAILLHIEGLAVFIGAIAVYASRGESGIAFALLLVPDLSMVGYIVNPRVGALTYNAAHTYTLPLALGLLSLALSFAPGVQLALIWFTHIGMDRMLGFGLKYPTEFKDTHLGRV